MLAGIGLASRADLESGMTDEVWKKIAALHADDAVLDRGSRMLVREHVPAALAMPLAITKRFVETPLLRMVRNLQNNTALDTVQNEYLRHTRLHEWFASAKWPTCNPSVTACTPKCS